MTYDEGLAERVREIIGARPGITERKMFGGLAWMVGGNMAVGVMSDGGLLVRIDPAEMEETFALPGVGPFGREGAKPMKGFARVDESVLESDAELARWVDAGAAWAATLPPK